MFDEPELGEPRQSAYPNRVGLSIGVGAASIAGLGLVTGAVAWVAIPWTIVAVASVPLWHLRDRESVGPWTYLFLSILLGVGIRSLAIQFGWPNENVLQAKFLLGEPDVFFVGPGLIMLVVIAVMALGYVAGRSVALRPGTRVDGLLRAQIDFKRATIIFGVVIGVATVLLVGLGGVGRLSQKRFAESSGAGVFLVAFVLAWLGGLLRLAGHAFGALSSRLSQVLITGCVMLIAVAIPFYTSSRTSIAWVVVSAAVVWFLGRGSLNTRLIIAMGVGLLVLTQLVTVLRARSDDTLSALAPSQVLETLIINRNFASLPKTAHIIQAVPEVLPYEYGATLTRSVWGLVPRALWSSKPGATGDVVVDAIYDGNGGGVPAGFVAEVYWNLGIGGTVVLAWLFGLFLSLLFGWFQPYLGTPLGSVTYAVIVMPIGWSVIGSQFSSAMLSAIVRLGIAIVIAAAIVNHATWARVPRSAGTHAAAVRHP